MENEKNKLLNYSVQRKVKVDTNIFSEEDFLKDCPASQFIPTILPATKRIIAIGDIHGDLQLAIKSFKIANLIDNKLNWIANPPDTIVIQVGDQIDSCRPLGTTYDCQKTRYDGDSPDDINVFNFFDEMHMKAKKVGGAVYSLLGNHELMNSDGEFRYVSYDNYHGFNYKSDDGKIYKGSEGRKNAFKPGGPLAKKMACTRNSIIIIGSTMFVHAGVLPVLAKRLDKYNFIDNQTKLKYLNAIIRKWLLHKLSENNEIVDTVKGSKYSPFWTRIFGSIPTDTKLDSNKCFNTVKQTLQVFSIGHIVVGHTPQSFTNEDGINGTCYEKDNDNKLYRIDGGFSRAFNIFNGNYKIQVLEIIDDNVFNIISAKD